MRVLEDAGSSLRERETYKDKLSGEQERERNGVGGANLPSAEVSVDYNTLVR